MKPTFQIILALSFLGQTAFGNPAPQVQQEQMPQLSSSSQVKMYLDANDTLTISGQSLCDSSIFRIRMDNTYYNSDDHKSMWAIPKDQQTCWNNPITMQLRRNTLEQMLGKVITIETSWQQKIGDNQYTLVPRHKFEFLVPCQNLAETFNGHWTRDNSTAQINPINCNAQPAPRPNYPPPVVNQQPIPAAPQAQAGPSVQDVMKIGRTQGDHMAKRVYLYYGQLENKMFSFAMGMSVGMNAYRASNLGIDSNGNPIIDSYGRQVFVEASTSDFQNGENAGKVSGAGKGEAFGKRKALSSGPSDASNAVFRLFDSAIDSRTRPNLVTPEPSIPPLNDVAPECPAQETLAQAIDKQNAAATMRSMLFNYGYRDFDGEVFNQATLQGITDYFSGLSMSEYFLLLQASNFQPNSFRRANFANSYGNSEWGFEMWKNRGLEDPNKRYQIDYLASLSPDMQQAFIDSFKAGYTDKIDREWDLYLRNFDPNFEDQGQSNGRMVMKIMMMQHGASKGCFDAYTASARLAFDTQYPDLFKKAYGTTALSYSQNPEIENNQTLATIIESSGKDLWLPGSGVSVVVSGIRNAGEVNGLVPVSVSLPGAQQVNVTAEALSSNKRNQPTPRLATLQNPTLNQEMNITATVGSKEIYKTVKVTTANVVAAISLNDANVNLYKQYLIGYLTTEWSKNDGFRLIGDGIYGAGKGSLLEEVINAANSLPPQQKASLIQNFKPTLASVYSNGNRGKLKEVNALLGRLN